MADERICSPDRHWMHEQGYTGADLCEYMGGMAQDAWEYGLAHRILSLWKPPEYVLEIGVYGGWTLMGWMMLGAKKAVAVDIYKRPSAPLPTTVSFIEGDSHSRAVQDLVKKMLPNGVDFLFIDGDHTLEGCNADYNMYAPMVRPGGVIGFHDIYDGNVRATWREMVRRYPTIQIQNKNPDDSRMGIGLVFLLPGVKIEQIYIDEVSYG